MLNDGPLPLCRHRPLPCSRPCDGQVFPAGRAPHARSAVATLLRAIAQPSLLFSTNTSGLFRLGL